MSRWRRAWRACTDAPIRTPSLTRLPSPPRCTVRERKQNHVATLEAKVAAYEAEKLTRDAKEEEAQRKLKSENASLTEENAGLKKKVAELEALVQQLQIQAANAAAAPPPPPPDYGSGPASWAPCNEVGCRAPSHEGPPSQRRKRPLPARASCPAPPPMTSSLDYQQQQPGSPHDNVATARFGAMSIAAASPPVVTGSSTLQLNPSSHGGWDDERGQPAALGGPSCGSSRPLPSRRESSPNLMPQNDIDMDRDCGFCTDSTPCLCRGEAILDLTGMDEDKNDSSFAPPASVDRGWMDGVDQMIKIEEEDFDDAFGPSPTYNGGSGSANNAASTAPASASATTLSTAYSVPRRPAVSISSLLSSRPKTSSRPKLWSTTSLPAALPSTGAAPTSTFTTTDPAAAPSEAGKKKLWWTKPASAQAVFSGGLTSFVPAAAPSRTAVVSTANNADSDALCSGDPSNCPACATDPALAAFCEAVGDDAASEASVSTVGPSMSLSRRGSITAASNAGDAENDNNHGGVSLYSQGREPATYGAITSPSRATGPYSSMPGYAVPLSSFRPRSTSSSLPTLRSLERTNAPSSAVANGAGYSIPDAFKQIRSHPAFPKWQGGLNLLADVVSGRAHPSSSGSSGALPSSGPSPSRPTTLRSLTAATLEMEERRARHPSVEIVPVSPRKTALIESTDRDVIHDSDHEHEGESRPRRVSISIAGGTEGDTGCLREQRARRPSLVPLSSLGAGSSSANGSSGGGDDGEHGQGRANGVLGPRGHKRRRLYLENDRVEEALRLLDWGALGNGNGSAGAKLTGRSIPLPLPSSSSTYGAQAGATSTPCSECPCPCPWARGGPAPAEGKEGEEGDGSGAGEGRGSWEEEQSRHAEAGQ